MEITLNVADRLTVTVEFDGEHIQEIWLPTDTQKTNIFELFSSDEILRFERKLQCELIS